MGLVATNKMESISAAKTTGSHLEEDEAFTPEMVTIYGF